MSIEAIKAAFYARNATRSEAIRYLTEYGHCATARDAARQVDRWIAEY